MRKWYPREELFDRTLPEARWTWSPPRAAFIQRKRSWRPLTP